MMTLSILLMAAGLFALLVGAFAAGQKRLMGLNLALLGLTVLVCGAGQYMEFHGHHLIGTIVAAVGAAGCIIAGALAAIQGFRSFSSHSSIRL